VVNDCARNLIELITASDVVSGQREFFLGYISKRDPREQSGTESIFYWDNQNE
jgi:hypothetical protein